MQGLKRAGNGGRQPNFGVKMVTTTKGLEDVRQYTAEQKKCFGQTITTVAGGSVTANVKFPQAGGQLLGFGFTKTVPLGSVTVMVNNEVLVQDINGAFLDLTNKNFEYYDFPRPLSATDVIKVTCQSTAVQQCFFAVYYI
jgi:hypothetical protein